MRSKGLVFGPGHNHRRPSGKGKGCALVLLIGLGGTLTGLSLIAYALLAVMT